MFTNIINQTLLYLLEKMEEQFSHLSEEEKEILINKGTEKPFSGEYNNHFVAGVFVCKACKNKLYESNSKFDSGCGWPSFDDEIPGSINRYEDLSGGRKRTEICCSNCGGHLGHVFNGERITEKDTRHCVNSLSIEFKSYNNLNQAFFGGGCFWSIDKLFNETNGVYMTQSGYMGGETENPTYEEVCTGKTNHAEVVQIYYDENIITYENLLELFWTNHNPTTLNRQGLDIGTQYRSVIFCTSLNQRNIAEKSLYSYQNKLKNKIVTEILMSEEFYRAEEYHQNYLIKNNLSHCRI